MRHINRVKGNFAIEDGEGAYLVAHAIEKEAEPVKHAVYSTIKGLVEAQQYPFDSLWNRAVPAEYRIRELEEGVIPDVIETLRDPYEIQRLAFKLIKSARDEILIMFEHLVHSFDSKRWEVWTYFLELHYYVRSELRFSHQ